MKLNFYNYLQLPGIYLFLLKEVWKQRRFNRQFLKPKISKYQDLNDGSLTKEDLKKITDYYALGVSGVLGTSFCVLRGLKMTTAERKAMTCLGGISGLLDDLFDDATKEVEHLNEFILNPTKMTPQNDHEELLLKLYMCGLTEVSDASKVQDRALKVYKAQLKSLVQQDPAVTEKILEEIMFNKGGSSFLYYRACLENSEDENEQKLIFHLGGLMQLGNDIFDVYKDYQENIHTLATQSTDIENLRKYFQQQLAKIFDLTMACDYTFKNKQKFLQIISLGISRVYVCLDQFEKLQNRDGKFEVKKYGRKELICDMQKPSNQLKALQYYFKIMSNR